MTDALPTRRAKKWIPLCQLTHQRGDSCLSLYFLGLPDCSFCQHFHLFCLNIDLTEPTANKSVNTLAADQETFTSIEIEDLKLPNNIRVLTKLALSHSICR